VIFLDTTHERLYLHCEECEWGWKDAEKAANPEVAFLTLDEEFETEAPTLDQIQQFGWARYALHSFDG
jgi:hypothetical protein